MTSSESKTTEVKKPLTKNQIITNIAETTGLTKKDVNSFVDALTEEIKKSLDKKGAGAFIFPGLFKIDKKQVKAQPAKTNVPNPFRPGEFIDKPAKPAHLKIRVRPLKTLKEMV
ncbi:MAG: HU family DNA-binding protein [Planctomycetaceae bacterium]|nr:HU family DNA-binding protein [Planctomycetaceae bacterium]